MFGLYLSHFIGDFLLQSDWMALNKSKNWRALCLHCLVYSLCFFWLGWVFVLVTFLLHLLTDAVTSRVTSKLWFVDLFARYNEGTPTKYPWFANVNMKKRHWFFVMIGLDQLIHLVTLEATLKWLVT